jgi:hypothetical protein
MKEAEEEEGRSLGGRGLGGGRLRRVCQRVRRMLSIYLSIPLSIPLSKPYVYTHTIHKIYVYIHPKHTEHAAWVKGAFRVGVVLVWEKKRLGACPGPEASMTGLILEGWILEGWMLEVVPLLDG